MTKRREHSILLAVIACAWVLSPVPAAEDSNPYAQVLGYTYGQSRKPLSAIEASVRGAKPEELKEIEGKLLKALQSATATPECKGWICGVLRQIGTEQSVAPVAVLLGDKDVSVRACIALQSLPGPSVDDALRDALGKIPTALKATVIQTIGARGDQKAVSALAPLVSEKDPGVASAAIRALGRIGSPEALDALKSAKVTDELKAPRSQALLLCADRLAAD
ncbi:MAG: HEAT repeat domain-containing protein, partial [Planctomycetota bacterium]|nr:HEAT repeat domain-containing protein [Planctomycetota bacterium]